MNVVHLSRTPLAGSPGRMSYHLNQIGVSSTHFYEKDYPGDLRGKMTMRSFHFTGASESIELLEHYLSEANVVHVHNYISAALVVLINKVFGGKKLIFHVHSPLREGPLFADVSRVMDLEFTDYYVVAQYQPRHYQEYTPICNIVPSVNELNPVVEKLNRDALSVIYSPAQTRKGGRWNQKTSKTLMLVLENEVIKGAVRLKAPSKMHEAQLLAYRQLFDVTIDEIVTGAFHQISLEGLSAGNIVVNNTDFFSFEMLKVAIRSIENPPFYLMSEADCAQKIKFLALLKDSEVEERKQESREYFKRYLMPSRLASLLVENYER